MSATGKNPVAQQQLQDFLTAGLITEAEYKQALAAIEGRAPRVRGQEKPAQDTKKPRHQW